MEKLFVNIFNMSISASYLILAVLTVRFLLRKAPKTMRNFLWLLVGIRLVVPFSIESAFSLIPDIHTVNDPIYNVDMPQYEENTTPNTMVDMQNQIQTLNITYTPGETAVNNSPLYIKIGTRIWIAGIVVMLAYMLISWLNLSKRVSTAVPIDFAIDDEHNTRVYQSEMIDGPFLFGIIKPRIYIPSRIAGEDIPYIIMHEKMHMKRKDYLIKPVGFLILAVYWFNPFIWASYIMLCKDVELICDERVVRELGEQCKKAYSQALLTSSVNRRMIAACPVAFGEISVKERVKNVLNYKKPAFWVIMAAVLACIIVPVCFMTQQKADELENTGISEDVKISETDYSIESIAGEYEMLISDHGEFLLLDEYNEKHENSEKNSETNGKYLFVPRLELGKDGTFSFGYNSFSSYLSFGSYELRENSICAFTDDDKYYYQFTIVDSSTIVFDAEKSSKIPKINSKMSPDAPLEDGSKFIKKQSSDKAEIQENNSAQHSEAYDAVEKWAQAFCNRDGITIADMADDKVEQSFMEKELMSVGLDSAKKYVDFGWSSPWPWGDSYGESVAEQNYRIVNVSNHSAEILYYAWVSDPHITVWREQITFEMENNKCIITSESLEYMDSICTLEEFERAYPDGLITGTMMDYTLNGAGEALNNNAKANRDSRFYEKLFSPDTAAVYLLNLLDNPNKASIRIYAGNKLQGEKAADNITCIVRIEFYEDGKYVDVGMYQPYGSDGIWLPCDIGSETNVSTDPYIINMQNVDNVIEEDREKLEALFPDHHEFTPDKGIVKTVDLNGDGIEEKVELENLGYNGGDGGYALKVTDTKTGKQIPLPDGYSETEGFPLGTYMYPPGDIKPSLHIYLGDVKLNETIAAISADALIHIYESRWSDAEKLLFKKRAFDTRVDAVSGCNIITYNNETTPTLVLKSYVSGCMGHADTLGYVITELRLQKDNTWTSKYYFLLDRCNDTPFAVPQKENEGNDIKFELLTPMAE